MTNYQVVNQKQLFLMDFLLITIRNCQIESWLMIRMIIVMAILFSIEYMELQ